MKATTLLADKLGENTGDEVCAVGCGMTDPGEMRNFAYRSPRLGIGLNVESVTNGEVVHGICKDISDAGVRADFDGSVTVGSSGLVILRHPAGVLKVNALVAHIEKYQVGLVFHFETSWEGRMNSEFIASITHDPALQIPQLPW